MKYSSPKRSSTGSSRCSCSTRDGDLAELCIALGKAMYKQADRFLSAYGLTPSQFEILTVLAQEGSIPLNRLSERLCCACSNITGIVDRLERDGLVERERSHEDRRVILLALTAKGKAKVKSVPLGGCCGMSFDGILNSDETLELRRILEKLLAAIT